MKRFWLTIAMISWILTPLAAGAEAPFNPDFVLSDRDLTDTSVPDDFAQRFLESRGGGIANLRFPDLDGSMKRPGDLITYYGRVYGVNPRFLLALIQKEQSLVYDPNPSVCQIDWATGYGRPDGSTCNDPAWQRYRGFTPQIVSAAAFVRFFYDKEKLGEPRTFGYAPGVSAVIDGVPVNPANLATAVLYSYTPHLHGNRSLAKIWSDWFAGSYPDGSYLADSSGTVWLIQGGLKRRFASKSALRSRVDPSRVIPAGDAVLASFEEGAPIRFAEYSLVRAPSGTVYLLVRDAKRPIESMPVFRSIGFNPEEIDDVAPEDLAGYADGEPITLKSAYPTGALLQDAKTGGVYDVEAGVKRPIYSVEMMRTNFPSRRLIKVSKTTLDRYADGEPVKFRDGELITSPGSNKAVFVVSNGLRRPIVSGQVFEQLGYAWKNVIHTNDQAVNIHPLGEPVTAWPGGVRIAVAP